MRGTLRLSALGVVLFGVSLGACASIVGADFGDVQGTSGSGITIDGGTIVPPGNDSGPIVTQDSGPVIADDSGTCPGRYTNCGGVCYDLSSDANHCHDCATTCPADPHDAGTPACSGGGCSYVCPDPYELCASGTLGCCLPSSEGGVIDSGGPDPGIVCGSATNYCSTSSGGFCCGDNQATPSGDFCANVNTPEGEAECIYVLYCSSSGECQAPASACCYDTNPYDEDPTNDPNGQTSSCQNSCPGGPYIQFCNPAKSECPEGSACTGIFSGTGESPLATNYYYCQ